ncbi:MAG: hypothetical protein FWD94_01960 [Treponema sp.]|nr:hypothetical protein [Treponema sp.]
MSGFFFWLSFVMLMICIGWIVITVRSVIKDWKYYDSQTGWKEVAFALVKIALAVIFAIGCGSALYLSYFFYNPGWGKISVGLAIALAIVAGLLYLRYRKWRQE